MEQMKTRKNRVAWIVFISLNALLIALTVTALCCLRQPLLDKLTAYEAARPENRCGEIFGELFADPDWEALYALAGVEDTPYEGSAEFAAYMQSKISEPLTFREVYCDTPATHRYLVLSGEETVAAFTMAETDGQWALGRVEVYFDRRESVSVEKRPGWTVFVNGVALDDSFTIRAAETLAEKYLPEGVHGWQLEEQRLSGLLMAPEVTAVDETGAAVALNWVPGTNRYTLPAFEAGEIPQALWQTARGAAVADATYALGALGAAGLREYFDANAPLYTMIVKNPRNLQKYTSASIDESSVRVSDYYRYSDDLFSARVNLTQNIIRKDGSLKVYKLDKTYFFTKNSAGKYLVTDYTNESAIRVFQQVRLTFATGEPVSMMVSADAASVTPPTPEIPAGAVFLGWATRHTDESGNVTMQLRILPDGSLRGTPEPMTLYPVFDTPEQ